MARSHQRKSLEPLAGPVLGIALVHVLVVMLLWIFLPLWQRSPSPAVEAAKLNWTTPESFLPAAREPVSAAPPKPVPAPEPPDKPAAVPPTAAVEPSTAPRAGGGIGRVADKYITLSPRLPEIHGPPAPLESYRPPSLRLLDIAAANEQQRAVRSETGGADMSSLDETIQQTYLKEWKAPFIHAVPPGHRSVSLDVSVGRDGSIVEATLNRAPKSNPLDASVLEVAQRVKKIPVALPSTFPKERYDVQVHFLVE